jgi:hypothetical protein
MKSTYDRSQRLAELKDQITLDLNLRPYTPFYGIPPESSMGQTPPGLSWNKSRLDILATQDLQDIGKRNVRRQLLCLY